LEIEPTIPLAPEAAMIITTQFAGVKIAKINNSKLFGVISTN